MKDKGEGVGGGREPCDSGPGGGALVEEREGGGGAGNGSDCNRIPEKAQRPHRPQHGESWSQSRLRGDFHISKDPACVSPPITAHHGLGVAWGQQEARLNEGSMVSPGFELGCRPLSSPSRKAREWFTLTTFDYAADNLGSRIPGL